MKRLHEDAVRLVRQRLIALSEGRSADAELLLEYVAEVFGLQLEDALVADTDPELVLRWRSTYRVPESAEMVTLLVNYAREPIYRIPDSEGASSVYESPIIAASDDAPEHLRPMEHPDSVLWILR